MMLKSRSWVDAPGYRGGRRQLSSSPGAPTAQEIAQGLAFSWHTPGLACGLCCCSLLAQCCEEPSQPPLLFLHLLHIRSNFQEIPCGPVVRAWCFQSQGLQFNPWSRNYLTTLRAKKGKKKLSYFDRFVPPLVIDWAWLWNRREGPLRTG